MIKLSLETYQNTFDAIRKFPHLSFDDALSKGQIRSKAWLVEQMNELHRNEKLPLKPTIFLLGGWYGTLASFLFDGAEFEIKKIVSFDINLQCADVADTVNRVHVMNGWRFKASTADMCSLNYNQTTYNVKRSNGTYCELTDIPDILINTSCEHVYYFDSWVERIPSGKYVVLQSNDFFESPEHVNCVNNVDELIKQSKLTTIHYAGELKLEKYTRFMVMGIK